MATTHAPSAEKKPINQRWDRQLEHYAKKFGLPIVVIGAITAWAGFKIFSAIGNSGKFDRIGNASASLAKSESPLQRGIGHAGTRIHGAMSKIAKNSTGFDGWQRQLETDRMVRARWEEAKSASEKGMWKVAGEHICTLRRYDCTFHPEKEEPALFLGIAESALNEHLGYLERAVTAGSVTEDDCYYLRELVIARYWNTAQPAALLEKIEKMEAALPFKDKNSSSE